MPLIVRLSHVCLNSKDLAETEAFYVGTLRFELAHEFINSAGERYGIILSSGSGTFLEFFRKPLAADNNVVNGTFRHICFQVVDIEMLANEFRRKGFEVTIVKGRTDGVPQFWIRDPDGTEIEFHEYSDPKSPQFKYV